MLGGFEGDQVVLPSDRSAAGKLGSAKSGMVAVGLFLAAHRISGLGMVSCMDLDTNSVTNLPGVDDREMDRLIALRAACQMVGPPSEFADVDLFVHEFAGWLKAAHSESDKLVRRYVLLLVTNGRSGVADRDAAKLRKTIDDIYRKA